MIVVLNPNSSASVTEGIAEACLGTTLPKERWRVDQLDAGPEAIESEQDVRDATKLVLRYAVRTAPDVLIVACHSDPGVYEARSRCPGSLVLGVGETSMLTAAAWAEKFGVVSLSDDAVARKWAMLRRLHLDTRCAAVEPTGTGVLDGATAAPDLEPYVRAANAALDSGATSLVLGCAGMANVAVEIQRSVDVPVVEPVGATLLVAAARRM